MNYLTNNYRVVFATILQYICGYLLLILLISNVSAQDWPRFRGDQQLLSRTNLKTPAELPNNFSELQLGSGAVQPLIADLKSDGQTEILYLQQGRLLAANSSGQLLINTFLAATELVTTIDLDGDNTQEIIAIDSFQRNLLVINADGTLRWQYQFPEFVALASPYIKIADVAPDRPGKEIIVFPDHTKTTLDAQGYFFSSQGTLYATPIVPNLFGGQLNFPQIAVADLDGSGIAQIVVVGRPRLMIFNGNGELQRQLDFREGDPEGRHYGLLNLADVNGDGTLEAVIMADDIPSLSTNNKSMAITVLQLTPTIKRLWGTSFPFPQILHAPTRAVADLDGDGRSEIIVNCWTSDEQQIRVYKGEGDTLNPGQPLILTTIHNAFVWQLQDLDNDGRPELLTSEEFVAQPSLSLQSQLKVYRLADASPNNYTLLSLNQSVTGMYLLTHASLATVNMIGSSDDSRVQPLILNSFPPKIVVYAQGPLGINIQEILLIHSGTKWRLKTDLNFLRPGLIRGIINSSLGSEQFLINREDNGVVTGELAIYLRMKKRLKIVGAPLATASGFTTQIRVADIDNDSSNEILISAPSGRILVVNYDEQTKSLLPVTAFPGSSSPIITKLVSGDRPQIVTTTSDNGRLRVVVYDTSGSVLAGSLKVSERWGRTLDIPSNTDVDITTGRFTGILGQTDIFLSTPRGFSLVLTGNIGDIVWSRSDVFTFGSHASVRDFNGDGKDDIYLVSNNLYRIVNGATGTELIGPIDVATLGGDFFSTPILTGTGEVLLVGPGTVIKMLEQGRLVWNFAKTINGKVAQRQQSQLLMGIAELGNGNSFDLIAGNYGENDTLSAYSYATGLLSYKTNYHPLTEILTVDLDKDGQDEWVFGTVEGQIIAIHAKDGSLLWQIEVDSFPGDPIIASIGRSKLPVLLVSPGNGTVRLYPLKSPVPTN